MWSHYYLDTSAVKVSKGLKSEQSGYGQRLHCQVHEASCRNAGQLPRRHNPCSHSVVVELGTQPGCNLKDILGFERGVRLQDPARTIRMEYLFMSLVACNGTIQVKVPVASSITSLLMFSVIPSIIFPLDFSRRRRRLADAELDGILSGVM